MKQINIYPKNKKKFIKLVKFSKLIIELCKKLKITPIAYGGLAVFIYTKNEKMNVNDIDFLAYENDIKKIIPILKNKKIKYKYSKKWHVLQIFENNLKVEIDSIDFWQKNPNKRYKKFKINGLEIRVVNLKNLIKLYKRASKTSMNKPLQYYKKYLMLKNLK